MGSRSGRRSGARQLRADADAAEQQDRLRGDRDRELAAAREDERVAVQEAAATVLARQLAEREHPWREKLAVAQAEPERLRAEVARLGSKLEAMTVARDRAEREQGAALRQLDVARAAPIHPKRLRTNKVVKYGERADGDCSSTRRGRDGASAAG